jgi:O-glycosyl hydrolase
LNVDGSLAVVVLNRTEDEIECALRVDGTMHRLSLPARSIGTATRPPFAPPF